MRILGSKYAHWVRTNGQVDCRQRQTGPSILRRRKALLGLLALSALGFRSIDGTGNNLANPTWGSVGVALLRLAPAQYGDGISTPGGTHRPSARLISNVIVNHPAGDLKNGRDLSNFAYAWGQFIDHDLDLTTDAQPVIPFNILVPAGDPSFDPHGTGTQVINLNRSIVDPNTGTSTNKPLQQLNTITSYIDGSMVYGSDAVRALALRTMSGGKLKTSTSNLLPLNTLGLPNANDAHITPDNELFLAGDIRANENIELTAVQTLFMREHNRVAGVIAAANPQMSDEDIYQRTKQYVTAEIQVITFNEYLPAILGPNAPDSHGHYSPNVNAGIANEFSTGAFRFGHSMLGSDVQFFNDQGQTIFPPISLAHAFSNPNIVKTTGIEPLLKYLASDNCEEIDVKVVDSLRDFLFGPPGSGGLDLASLNIQRGRDHGIADYNTTRAAYGLRRVQKFSDITSDTTLQNQLQSMYNTVDNIDLWVGGLAEDHLPGSSVGPTFTKIIADQFTRLRDGDRFWFTNVYSGHDLDVLQQTTLASVIKRNTTLTNLQDDVFFFTTEIAGRAFVDLNRNGKDDPGEPGIPGRVIQLLDASNSVITTATTDGHGAYRFDHVDLGAFQVTEVLPKGVRLSTPSVLHVNITRGMDVEGQSFGDLPQGPPPPPPPQHRGGGK